MHSLYLMWLSLRRLTPLELRPAGLGANQAKHLLMMGVGRDPNLTLTLTIT